MVYKVSMKLVTGTFTSVEEKVKSREKSERERERKIDR